MNQIRVMLDSTRNITMDFVWIKPGSFTNGGTTYTLDEGIYFAKTELTRAQWTAVMGTNAFGSAGYTSNYPFSGRSFTGNSVNTNYTNYGYIYDFLVNKLPNTLKNGHYRAPTSAEWDYAARAGTATKFYFGDDVNALGGYEWYNINSANQPKEVGGKWPNPWGLHDMLGNFYELTDLGIGSSSYSHIRRGYKYNDSASVFDASPYRSLGVTNPTNSSNGDIYLTLRVVRTGP
jgi:formylglycine-generating enzyme required for sulfatase activity